jgi:phage-related holin
MRAFLMKTIAGKIIAHTSPTLLVASGIGALIQKYIFSDTEYLTWLLIAVMLDLITGITKVWVNRGLSHVTSRGLRMTVIKFIQYGAFLIITHTLANFTVNGQHVSPLAFIENWAYSLLILIEAKSVYENIVAINPKLDFIKPLIDKISKTIKDPENEEEH